MEATTQLEFAKEREIYFQGLEKHNFQVHCTFQIVHRVKGNIDIFELIKLEKFLIGSV